MQSFKNIIIGGIPKGTLIRQLSDAGIKFNDYALALFELPEFELPNQQTCIDLVKVSLPQIGLSTPSVFDVIVNQATSQGYSLCPLAVAAYLRLEYMEQPEGPYLTIASKSPVVDPNFPNGFYLRSFENSLWLRGYRASADYLFPAESEFVFTRNG